MGQGGKIQLLSSSRCHHPWVAAEASSGLEQGSKASEQKLKGEAGGG